MRRILIPFVCLCSLLVARPAQAGWRDWVSPSKNWQRVKNCCTSTSNRVKAYCREKVDRAKADQAKEWGLKLPADLTAGRPLVVCVHGLDSTSGVFDSMAVLLRAHGYQVAYFSYPSDGPIADSADRLATEMAALEKAFPTLRVDLIGHSMGALVARAYLEGDRYGKAVDRFIAIAPPNHGSPWTRQRWMLEMHEQYWLWRTNKAWSPIWMFTDGHGEAADDLKPDSAFLKALNGRPRRAGVRYTIVCGDHHIVNRFTANALRSVEWSIPKKQWWGVRQTVAKLERAEACLDASVSGSDGVVPIESAKLDGVSDVVLLHGDHNTLCMSDGRGEPPVAWGVVRDRLAAR